MLPLENNDRVTCRLVRVAVVGWMLSVELRPSLSRRWASWSWMVGLLLSLVSALDWWRVLVSGRVV